MRKLFIFALAALCLTTAVHAEKADSSQPTNIEADQMDYDDVKQVNVFTGNVVMTRGTLLVKAGRAVVRQDPEGYQYMIAYAAPGKLASYRQKRDGGEDLWMEAYGERIEYDNKTEIAKFFNRARLKRLEGPKVTDEVNGAYISYDGKTEFFTVHNTQKGVSQPGAGRVKVVIQPRESQLEKHDAKTSKANAKATKQGSMPPKNPSSATPGAEPKGGAAKAAEPVTNENKGNTDGR
jgi:lipopolysaccharide export system protein LptA